MKKSLLWVVVLVLSISMVAAFSLYSCKPAADTEVAAEGAGHFEGIDIWFSPGGPESGPFATVVYNGAKAAEEDLGPNVTYYWSDWDNEKMINDFKTAVAAEPDAICVMGHPGEDAFGPLIDEAEAKGIVVFSQNTELPDSQAKYGANGFGYVGASNYSAGVKLGEQCVIDFGLVAGDKALVWGLLSAETRGLRSQGCIDGLEEAGVVVDYIEISSEVNADATLGTPIITGYIAANPDVKLVITDHGALTATAGTYATAANLEPGEVNFAGFDLSAAAVQAIQDGYLGLILDQQPYLQGYVPILSVCLTVKYGFGPLNVDTGSGFVNAANVDLLAGLAAEGIR
ncbi:MAG: substrate-binding domain-containing protein [Actinobacteria bacterium]|nr:substrate-binding domain-containing protein [Actinomycetota bacterium]